MGMAPGRGVLVVVMMMVMAVPVTVMTVIVVVTVIVRVIVMRLTMRMMIVAVVMMLVLVIVMLMIVRRGHRGADRMQRTAHAARGIHKAPALDPDQPRAHQRDQRVADDLDHTLGVAELSRRSVEHDAGDADDGDRDNRLQQRRGKRQHDAAPPGLV